MELKDFSQVRVGSGYPACVDVSKIQGHENDGVMAVTYVFEHDEHRVELRRLKYQIALFTFKYDDMELPGDWKNSELLWAYEKIGTSHNKDYTNQIK